MQWGQLLKRMLPHLRQQSQRSGTRSLATALLVALGLSVMGVFLTPDFPMLLTAEAAYQRTLNIRTAALESNGKGLVIQTDQPLRAGGNINITRMLNELVIDFPDATLSATPPKAVLPVKRDGIQEIRFMENKGVTYSNVRISVVVKDNQALESLTTDLIQNGLRIGLVGRPDQKVAQEKATPVETPATPRIQLDEKPLNATGKNVIRDVFFRDGQLVIQSLPNGVVAIKNQFSLTEPNRLVVDIHDAALASRSLTTPLDVNEPDVQKIRVGQFDPETVRIVIETPKPDQFLSAYLDRSRSALSLYPTDASRHLLGNGNWVRSVGVVEARQEGQPEVRLNTTGAMAHTISRDRDLLYVDLPNVNAEPGWVGFNRQKYPQISFIKLDKRYSEKTNREKPGTQVVIGFKDDATGYVAQLSPDKKSLGIAVMNTLRVRPGSKTASGSGKKAPFAARIVIDAGHGGKDRGTSRSGVLEKDLNLKVALKLRKELESRGLRVYMTRETDKFLPLPTITGITNRIRPDLFVSIHHNASVKPQINGIETYYYTSQSIPLAKKVHQQMVRRVKAPDRGVRRARFYVVHHTPVPAILCELGYVSNPTERRALTTEWRQNLTVRGIADGVVAYLETRATAKAR